MNVSALSAAELLKLNSPEKIFTNDAVEAKKEYRALANRWHPDRENGDEIVFKHIKEQYEKAEKQIEAGIWHVPGVIDFTTIDGRRFQVRYRKHHSFELGEMYITDTVIVYMIDKSNKDLIENSKRTFKMFKYANDKMKKEFQKYLPEVQLEVETADHHVVVYKKTPDLFLLRDLIDHFDGELPSEHAAWIMSSLYNLVCYFKYSGISHNAISPDTYFVSPKYHSGAMLGGWWYSSKVNERLIAVPERTLDHCSDLIVDKKSMASMIDLQLVKTTGLEILGDIHGSKILLKAKSNPKKYPAPFTSWLRTPPRKNADPVKEYATYKNEILKDSWGPPKFFELKVEATDVYDD